jgi:hypothetical protein
MKKKSSDKEPQGLLAYEIDKDGNKSNAFLTDDVPPLSAEAKDLIRKKLVNLGIPENKIDIFMKYVR